MTPIFKRMLLKKHSPFYRSFTPLSHSRELKFLEKHDKVVYELIRKEEIRQSETLNLIASENYASSQVLDALGTCLTNKYSEGYPGARYYAGNEHIDELERICQARALKAFNLSPEEWGVNVQPYSGSTANFSVFSAVLSPFDRVMGLGLASGGHLSHGYYNKSKAVNCSAKFFSSLSYDLNPETGLIDFEGFEKTAKKFHPKLVVTGASAYPRDWDYKRFREVTNSIGATLLADISHTSGLISAGLLNSPFDHTDIVMTTTHKTLGGPRGALIFYKNELKQKIDFSVFPHTQGGPHNNNIAAIAVQLGSVATTSFKQYSTRVVQNAKALSQRLLEHGFKICTGGTDTHLVLLDLKNKGVSGSAFEKMCENVNITINKNTVFGDASPFKPSGARLGTPALTARGLSADCCTKVADFLQRALLLTLEFKKTHGEEELEQILSKENFSKNDKILSLRKEIREFASKFGSPGIKD